MKNILQTRRISSFDNSHHVKSIEEIACDINYEEYDTLTDLGVFETLRYDDETNCITIDCPTNFGYEGKTDEEGIRTFIKERISNKVSVVFRKVTLLMLSSPIVAENPSG